MSNGKKAGLVIGIIFGTILIVGGVVAIILLSAKNYYDVVFDSNGGTKIATQKVKEGDQAIKPVDPTKEKSTFIGWYLNNQEYDFKSKVMEPITLVAKWQLDPLDCSMKVSTDEATVETHIIAYFDQEEKVEKVAYEYEFDTISNASYYCDYLKALFDDTICKGNKITIPDATEVVETNISKKVVGMSKAEFKKMIELENDELICK